MRKQLINDLSKLIKTLKSSKDENDILLLKDLQKIRKVLRDGGDVLDIQNVARWNYSAYFNVDLPENMSLKTYRYGYRELEIINNAFPCDFVFKGFYDAGNGWFRNFLPIYQLNGMEYIPMSEPYIIG